MSATARTLADAPAEAVIVDAEVVAGHDGAAEMLVRLKHGNGAIAPVSLDAEVGFALMKHCGVASLAELAGHSWRKIVEGL